jgi:hypothetical protein
VLEPGYARVFLSSRLCLIGKGIEKINERKCLLIEKLVIKILDDRLCFEKGKALKIGKPRHSLARAFVRLLENCERFRRKY